MKRHEEIKQAIIAAAMDRLSRYGYGKTTMAELAGDCKMSAGNLYRYFMSKLDIAEEIARQSFIRTAERLREVVRRPNIPAIERLRSFLLEQMQMTFQELEKDQHWIEMAEIVARERPHVANEGLARVRSLIAEILAMGNATGEFDIEDVNFTAEMIQSATFKFRYPQLFSGLALDKLEREAAGVIDLLIDGLRRRPTALAKPADAA
ncbi:TetR/AcrR family transcriptional regulator [Zavarzinia compransoris]|uniref:TetR/AcrR family transcriptional regulator n=1 Tax=Zavarzinia compransoris TaxID=1264899 RepID=A0A317E2W3_9PROT|nr:TetR/AcrR family transcriptional regulator [Zavarzinia compransoris]PWR20510.1 TetR/AcrR family transcriptional regulator [Zavarzinia compransoris]TDP43843.1 TetR family transcriptional regulator [Zavarzinia compransoris]